MIRRTFLKKSALIGFTAFLFGSLKVFADALKIIDMSGKTRNDKDNAAAIKTAAGLGYVDSLAAALKAGKIKKVDQGAIKAASQTCAACQFYKEVEKGKAGTCTLIPKVLVHADGSCNTWVKKS